MYFAMIRNTSKLVTSCIQNFNQVKNMCSTVSKYELLNVSNPKKFVYHVEINRPDKMNAMNKTLWSELGNCFESLSRHAECRAIVLSGEGKLFCAGIDFNEFMGIAPKLAELEEIMRKAKLLESLIGDFQRSMSSLEICQKPVLAAIHSACIGGGVDLITAADIRYCTKDAWFQIKEVHFGMAADIGTLQRLPKIIGSSSLVRELCYTGRKIQADEAFQAGLVSRVFDNKESLIEGTLNIAEEIAAKSPVAVQGTKRALNYSRDHSVQEGLDHIRMWNSYALQSDDFVTAVTGMMTKEDIGFSKL